MPALRDVQRAFARYMLAGETAELGCCIDGRDVYDAGRLGIYANTARTTLMGALRLTFPCVDRLVGADFFDMVAGRYGRHSPPRTRCLADYGANFAAFLGLLPETEAIPYLCDVAEFEWALARAAAAEDVPSLGPADAAGLVAQGNADLLHFTPHRSVSLLDLAYPADQIADAVAAGDETAMRAVDLGSSPVRLIVDRGAQGVRSERITAESHAFLLRLFRGDALGAALDDAGPEAAAILADQFAKGRLAGAAFGVPEDGSGRGK